MRLPHRCFPVKSAKFLRTAFPCRTPTVAPSDSINADEKKKKESRKKIFLTLNWGISMTISCSLWLAVWSN